jgi:hypothetical protein
VADWRIETYQIGDETRSVYFCEIAGPSGCTVELCAEEWQSCGGRWAAVASLLRPGSGPLLLWRRGVRGAGLPSAEAAQAEALVWLRQWCGGWAAIATAT